MDVLIGYFLILCNTETKTKENVSTGFMTLTLFLSLGMVSSLLLVYLSALVVSFVCGEAEIRFTGQTEFFVNETSTTVIRFVIERIGEPANVTAIVSVRYDCSCAFNQMRVTLFSLSRDIFNCLGFVVRVSL